jgi:hypothetical protein
MTKLKCLQICKYAIREVVMLIIKINWHDNISLLNVINFFAADFGKVNVLTECIRLSFLQCLVELQVLFLLGIFKCSHC